MRADRGHDKHSRIWHDNGSSGGKRVSSGSRGSGDNESVGIVFGQVGLVDKEIKPDQARTFTPSDYDVVQTDLRISAFVFPFDRGLQHRPLIDSIISHRESLSRDSELWSAETGKKAERTKVNTHHRLHFSPQVAHQTQESTIAAQGNEQVHSMIKLIQ